MIMIPLHYLITLGALYFAGREFFENNRKERNGYFLALLLMLAVQAALVGTRFGYSQEWLREIQPVTAAILPPLAYLSFRERNGWAGVLPHLFVPVAAALIALFATGLLDVFLALNNLLYGLALTCIGLRGPDGLAWARVSRVRNWLLALWVLVGLLVYSGITDAVIALDYFRTDGRNTPLLVGYASIAGLIGTVGVFLFVRFRRDRKHRTGDAPGEETRKTFETVDQFLKRERLYLDPDLNLNRIARRLSLPTREVSRAINASTGQNVSQYVNALRIGEACRLIGEEAVSVTNAIYASGFNTKSNFNREFLRVTGKTPSEWRSTK